MIRSIICAVMTAVFVPVAVLSQNAGDSLTRDEVVRLTLTNQPQIMQAQQNLTVAEARVDVNRAALWPDIGLVGVYTRLDPVAKLEVGGATEKLFPNDNYDVQVDLEHTLYDFGRKRTAISVAQRSRQMAQDNIDLVRLTLAYQAISAFNNALILQNTIAVIDSQLVALRQHAAVSTKKIQAGTATNYDTLTTQVRIAVATNDRTDAVRALNSQIIILHELTGLPDASPINLKGDYATVTPMPQLDSLLQTAENQRPEMVMARDAEQVAATQTHLVSLGDKPSLSLAVGSGFKNGYFPNIAEPHLNWNAGLIFRMPLFNGHRTQYEESGAHAALEAAKQHTADMIRKITGDVRQAFLDVQTSLSKIATTEVQIRQAEQAVAMAVIRYQAGVITNVELLDAQTALLQTRLIRLRALYEYTVGLANLDRATGRRMW
ncbi:putative Outer membrane efflux protein [Candidatus Zixiibacteriota bacterium]|nr:putative Outer membrane efflux protein [candidate division Zixibacteria bacterium]